MKKLNRKGFTLIELLAVIVILAIVLVVTIPSVISSMNSARENQLQNAVDTVSEWFTKQYEQAKLGVEVDDRYSAILDVINKPIFNYLERLSTNSNDATLKSHANSFFGYYSYNKNKLEALKYNISEQSIALLGAAGISNVEDNICTANNGNDTNCSTEAFAHYSGFQLQGNRICVQLCAKEGGSFWSTNTGAEHCKLTTGCSADSFNLSDWQMES